MPQRFSPSKARAISYQATSPNHPMYSGPERIHVRREKSKPEHYYPDNFNISEGGISSFVHADIEQPDKKRDHAAALHVTTDHVQNDLFSGTWGTADPSAQPPRPRVGAAEHSILTDAGGVGMYLKKTAGDTLPVPKGAAHENHKVGALEVGGGVFPYLARLEAEAASRDAQAAEASRASSLRAGAHAGSQKDKIRGQRANGANVDAAGGLGRFIMSAQSTSSAGKGMGYAAGLAFSEGSLGSGVGGIGPFMTMPTAPPKQSPLAPQSQLQVDGDGSGTLGGYMEAALEPPPARSGDADAPASEVWPAGRGGPRIRPHEGELDKVGGLIGAQDPTRNGALRLSEAHTSIVKSPESQAFLRSPGIHSTIAGAGIGGNRPGNIPDLSRFGRSSSAAVHLTSSEAAGVPMDMRRLTRLRRAIRTTLPTDAKAASLSMRRKLLARDGDKDGRVGDEEMMRVLLEMSPGGVLASDVGFLCRYLRERAGRRGAGSSAEMGSDVDDVTSFFTLSQEGMDVAESTRAGAGRADESAHASVHVDARARKGVSEKGAIVGRLDFTSAGTAFQAFRNTWEERHGSAARHEQLSDACTPAEGPSWSRAAPQPFKVLHLAGGPPCQ